MAYSTFEQSLLTDFLDSSLTSLKNKLLDTLVVTPVNDNSHRPAATKRFLQLLHRANLVTIPEYYWGFDSYDFTRDDLSATCKSLSSLAESEGFFNRMYTALRGISDKAPIDRDLYQLITVDLSVDLNIPSLLRCLMLLSLLKGYEQFTGKSI